MQPDYSDATYEDLFGPPPKPAPGQSHYDPDFLALKGAYTDQKARFIGSVPLGSDYDNALRSQSSVALTNCDKYGLGQIVFYTYIQGGDKQTPGTIVLGIAVPESPIHFRYPFYETFRDNSGNFVSEFHRNMVNSGHAIFNPPGLHPFANPGTHEKNDALINKALEEAEGEEEKKPAKKK